MPLYEYHCKSCNDSHEVLQPMGKIASEIACPECQTPAQKMLSVFSSVTPGSDGAQSPMAGCGAPSCCMATDN